MDSFINFLREYKEVILSALAVLLTFICILIKRKPKTLDDFTLALSDVLNFVPSLVIKAEEPKNGEAKRDKVLQASLSLMSSSLQRALTSKERSIVIKSVSEQIESVLTAPQKKLC